MRDEFKQVMKLQAVWTYENTAAMQERGHLIRDTLPTLLKVHADTLQTAMGIPPEDFAVTGRDGTGRKTQIPWVRFNSLTHSPRPTNGWYCVYLFDATGKHVYLALAHGSTRFTNGVFVPRSSEEVGELVQWATGLLKHELNRNTNLTKRIELNARSELGEAYASSTVAAIRYPIELLPTNSELLADAQTFANMLGKLYSAETLGISPESVPPELAAASAALEEIANPLRPRRGGQGFGLNGEERKAVEKRAMAVATQHWLKAGYTVRDVSATQSYDLEAIIDGNHPIYVEVKGTTSGPESIMLTSNEVVLHQYQFPNTALVVVHGISLNRTANPPEAEGGAMVVLHPWKIEVEALTPLSYKYELPAS